MKLSTCFCKEFFIYRNYARIWTSQTRLVSLSRTHSPLLWKKMLLKKGIYDRKKLFNNCHHRSLWPFLVADASKPIVFDRMTARGRSLTLSRGSLGTPPLMISGTIKASQTKLCTLIVPLKTFQNTKKKIFYESYLWRPNDVITKNWKNWTSAKPDKL